MHAVILAAGRSTRTYPLTLTRPKPLIPIWDRPLLEHQLTQLSGIADEVLLVVGYRKEQIEARLGYEYAGIRLRYVHQKSQRGTADAVLAARPFVSSRTLILNGDDFYHRRDLAALVEGGRGLLVTRAPDPQNRAVVRIENDAVVDIVEKPKAPDPDAWCSVGGYCVEADDLDLLDDLPLSPRGELELPDFILELVKSQAVRPQFIGEWWLPLTYAWDVLVAMQHIWAKPDRARDLGIVEESHDSLRNRPDVAWEDEATLAGPIQLGSGVRIGKGARLVGPATIGAACTVGAGANVERSALFENTKVGEGAKVLDSVLGAGVEVGASAELQSRPGRALEIEVHGKTVVPELERLGAVIGDGAKVPEESVVPAGTLIAGEARSP